MNEFKYIWVWSTYISVVKWGVQVEVKSWETIRTEMDTKIMLANKFILVTQEVDNIEAKYYQEKKVKESKIESTETLMSKIIEDAELLAKKTKKDKDVLIANLEKTMKAEEKAFITKLRELESDENKQVVAKAKKALLVAGEDVKEVIDSIEFVKSDNAEMEKMLKENEELKKKLEEANATQKQTQKQNPVTNVKKK